MIDIIRLKSRESWEQQCYREIKKSLTGSSLNINIALSGGSTPVDIYKRIGKLLKSFSQERTENIRFFVVDERNVPISSIRSNSRMIMETIGQKFVVPFDPTSQSAQDYWSEISHRLEDKGTFDLVVLGCGEDGHTASLFPNTPLLNHGSPDFLRNELPSGELRFSMTYPLIMNASKRLIFVDNNKAKWRYFTFQSLQMEGAPIHRIFHAPKTKAIIHE